MKRVFDLTLSLCAVLVAIVPAILIAGIIKCTSVGPVLYWSNRVGKHNKIFKMAKFRSMHVNTPIVATHLLNEPEKYVTKIGKFLRRTSLDEIPQLVNIIKGEMSIVGPRPALFNQNDLIKQRTQMGIHVLTPGLTGWAQINGRDNLSIPAKVDFDNYYLLNRSLKFDVEIIFKTILKIILRKDVIH